MYHLPDVSDMQLLFSAGAALFVLGLLLFSPIPVPALPAPLAGPCIDIAAKAAALPTANIPRYSSLFLAAAENCVESVCLLLQKGADINARNKYGPRESLRACCANAAQAKPNGAPCFHLAI